jgi:hypothetical protein
VPSPKIASARTIANRKARVVMNRAALDEMQLAMADGLLTLGQRIIAGAQDRARQELFPEEDAALRAKRGVPMMADTGHSAVWALGKKVGGEEGEIAKPRGLKTPANEAVLAVWFSSPLSHFREYGTIKEPARPFLTPELMADIPNAGDDVKAAIARWASKGGRRAPSAATVAARLVNTLNAGTLDIGSGD